MKSTILLTTALFLVSAPAPDAKTISELSAGFLSVDDDYALMASDTTFNNRPDTAISLPAETHAITDTFEPDEEQINQAERGNAATKTYASIN